MVLLKIEKNIPQNISYIITIIGYYWLSNNRKTIIAIIKISWLTRSRYALNPTQSVSSPTKGVKTADVK